MFKISTKIALAALISISTLSTVDASRKIRGVEYEEVGMSPLRTIKGEERNRTLFQRTARLVVGERDDVAFEDDNNHNSRSFDREPQPYSSYTQRGTHIGYNDDASFWDKNKGKIIAGATVAVVVTSALIYTAVKYMSGTTQDEQEQNQDHVSYHPGVVYDPIVNFTAEILAQQTENAVRLGLNLVASPDTAVALYDPKATQTFTSSFMTVASSFFAPFSEMIFGRTN